MRRSTLIVGGEPSSEVIGKPDIGLVWADETLKQVYVFHRARAPCSLRARLVCESQQEKTRAVLDRHGLVKRRRARRNRATGTVLSLPGQPNDLWCADYKGEFMLADRRYCYPLTVTDAASRYLFACEALSTTKEAYAFPVFEAVFKQFGLPKAIRTDNGVPFASPNSLFNLSKLSVWWL